MTTSDKVHTIRESAMRLRISRPTMLNLLREGRVHAVQVGARGQWRITDAALAAFLRGGSGGEEAKTAA